MKNFNKIPKYFIALFWFGLSCSILKAEVVITEIFIKQAVGSHTPQYIELYNKDILDAVQNQISKSNYPSTKLYGDGFAGKNITDLLEIENPENVEILGFEELS